MLRLWNVARFRGQVQRACLKNPECYRGRVQRACFLVKLGLGLARVNRSQRSSRATATAVWARSRSHPTASAWLRCAPTTTTRCTCGTGHAGVGAVTQVWDGTCSCRACRPDMGLAAWAGAAWWYGATQLPALSVC
eukprot:164992-Chlamydomonas_euryale.AAC.3